MTLQAQLLVLAKEPLPGRAKTRLSPALSPAGAADVARACLEDTLAAVAGVDVLRRTVVLDGSPVGWLPGWTAALPQRSGPLGTRISGALADAHAALPVPMLLIGMDTPQVSPRLLTDALEALLAPHVATDPFLDAQQWEWGVEALHRIATAKRGYIADKLAGPRPGG